MLAEQFAIAARLYVERAVKLAASGGVGINYTRLRDETIQAQERSEIAFRALTEHVASHQCGKALKPSVDHRRRNVATGL